LSNLNKLPEGVYIPDDPISSASAQPKVVCMALDHPGLDLADVDSDDGGGDEEEVDTLEMFQLETQLKRAQTEVVTIGEVCKILDQYYPEDEEIANAAQAAIASGGDPVSEQDCTRAESIQQEDRQNEALESTEFRPARFDTYEGDNVMGLHYMITFILYIPFPFIFYIH
jgi:hypothetical protein